MQREARNPINAMSDNQKHVVMFSGGVSSWAAAKRVAERYGTDNLTLLFADTKMEDEDLYRFLDEAAANVGGELVKIADGRTPWEVFRDERFIGNSRIDPCSKKLKRNLLDRYMDEHFDPADVTRHVGIDIVEAHRLQRLRERAPKWTWDAPLLWKPELIRIEVFDWLEREGIRRPRLYDMQFPHNNCGGFCCKAGHGQFVKLLEAMPERFAFHERKELEMLAYLGRDDVSILTRTVRGKKRPMTLRELRERHERQQELDIYDFGGCGCAID